jgi:hypothetical protein
MLHQEETVRGSLPGSIACAPRSGTKTVTTQSVVTRIFGSTAGAPRSGTKTVTTQSVVTRFGTSIIIGAGMPDQWWGERNRAWI